MPQQILSHISIINLLNRYPMGCQSLSFSISGHPPHSLNLPSLHTTSTHPMGNRPNQCKVTKPSWVGPAANVNPSLLGGCNRDATLSNLLLQLITWQRGRNGCCHLVSDMKMRGRKAWRKGEFVNMFQQLCPSEGNERDAKLPNLMPLISKPKGKNGSCHQFSQYDEGAFYNYTKEGSMKKIWKKLMNSESVNRQPIWSCLV